MGGKLSSVQGEVIIELSGVGRNYVNGSNQVEAIKGIDLRITKGEFIGIMGPSASGKSTLINMIGCMDSPTSGEYRLKGVNIEGISGSEKASIRNKVFGFVFQAFHLLPELDVASNVALPLKYSKIPKKEWESMVKKALATVGLDELGSRYPDQLSGGQQQRVAIARALVNNPDVILADEPTGNLDSATGQSIMEELLRLKEVYQRTVIVITHDSKIAGYAERLIRLEDGRITEDMQLSITSKDDRLINPFQISGEEESDEYIL
ncbi:MAG: hypothetical protein K0R09_3898 [Clostridiales bacterium]|nr:hypothetical protein [Clostridiales bacterium]